MAQKPQPKPSKYMRPKRAGDNSTSKTVRLPNDLIDRFEIAQHVAKRIWGDTLETSYTDIMKVALEEFIADVERDEAKQGKLNV